jgi:hypothetical protein
VCLIQEGGCLGEWLTAQGSDGLYTQAEEEKKGELGLVRRDLSERERGLRYGWAARCAHGWRRHGPRRGGSGSHGMA